MGKGVVETAAPFFALYQPYSKKVTMKYYVYQHADPETEEILYIGKGSYERAWLCRGNNVENGK